MNDSRQLANQLRHDLLEGRHSASEPFPSLRELARQHETGLRVARNAVDILVNEGLLYRRERSGTFVRLASGDNGDTTVSALRCVNVLERATGTLPTFVRSDYLQGHTQALDATDMKMRVMAMPAEVERLPTILSDQFPFTAQACVLINITYRPVLQWLIDHQVPFIVQNYTQYAKESLPPHHSVAVNKVRGAFEATQFLIEQGHRRIGYAGCSEFDSDDLLEVYEGYAAAMRCGGLEVRQHDIMPVNTDEPHMAFEPALRWMKERDLPTAILARNDAAAIGILNAATALGIAVPGQLSVIGFNNQVEAETSTPPLTTVGVPRVQLGREAIDCLLEATRHPAAHPITRILNCHLVHRESCSPPS